MPRGRPAKPLEQHRREGTLRPVRHGTKVVQIGGRTPPPAPPGVSDAQKECWEYLVADLGESATMDHADAGIVEAAASMWGTARQMQHELDGDGYTAEGARGTA